MASGGTIWLQTASSRLKLWRIDVEGERDVPGKDHGILGDPEYWMADQRSLKEFDLYEAILAGERDLMLLGTRGLEVGDSKSDV